MSLCTLLFSQRIWHSINLWSDHWRWILQTCCSSFISTSDQSSHLREDHCGRVLALNLANIFALLLWTAATLCTTSGLSWSSLRFTSIIFHEHTSLQFWLDLLGSLALNPNLLAKAFTTAVTPQTGFAGLQVLKQLPWGSCSHSGVRPAHARCHSMEFGMVRGSQSERAKSQKELFKNIIFGSHLAVSTEQARESKSGQDTKSYTACILYFQSLFSIIFIFF